MQEQTKELRDYLDAFRRRKISILVTIGAFFAISLAVALLWPPTFRSTATILIEEQEIPSDLVRSTITSFAEQRIQSISQRVMTRANLGQIIDKYDLYRSERRRKTMEEILESMRKDIKVETISADVIDPRSGRPTPATIAFTLSYDGERPDVTQKVASELTNLYLNENLKNRTEKASETNEFLSAEAERLGQHISELETKLAAFKEKNIGRLPELNQFNLSVMDRTERELNDVNNQLQSLADRKFYLDGQLAQIDPQSTMIGSDGQKIMDPATRLKALRSEYVAAQAKYAPDYPDVVRLKREIEALEKQTGNVDSSSEQAKDLARLRAELAEARSKYSDDHPDVIRLTKAVAAQEAALKKDPLPEKEAAKEKPDNPAYLTLQAQLEGVKTEIQAATAHREELKAKLANLEKRIQQAPEVERGYLALTRDYENSIKRYQEIKAKQMEAEVGEQLEKERKGERFSLIDPPQLPEEPVRPNRPAIIILGFLLSVFGGVGYAAVAENIDPSIRGARGVEAVVDAPPLAVIPYIKNRTDALRLKRTRKFVVAGFIAGLIVLAVIAHLMWTPLDVLWFKGLRKVDTVIGG
jgi:succinoglycan biosynthesis transport protein ExoP